MTTETSTEPSFELLDVDLEKIDTQMGELLEAFQAHPKMQPPEPNRSVLFVYDFIRNTHRNLKCIDFEGFRAGDISAHKQAKEILGRNRFACTIVYDTTGGLGFLTGSDPNVQIDFGDEIRTKVKALAGV